MTRMKRSNSLFLEAGLRETIFCSEMIGVHYIHSNYNLKGKSPELDLLLLSTSPPRRQIAILQQLKPIIQEQELQSTALRGG